jgi:hypothetical protein
VEIIVWAIVLSVLLLASLFGVGATELQGLDRYELSISFGLLGLFLLIYRLRYSRL